LLGTLASWILCLLLTFPGCGKGQGSSVDPAHDYRDPSLDVEVRVHALMSQMTLREKVDEMSSPPASASGALMLLLRPHDIGSNERLGIPALGLAGSSRGAILYGTAFPVSMARGASWNVDLEERVNQAIGAELKAVGGNVLLGPTINLLRHPGWGRSQETYGEDPHHLSRFAVAAVNGIQRHVMAQVKHFALNSIEDDRGNIDVIVDERTLREVYLPHFKAAVLEAGAASIMSSYNRVNGQYMGEHRHLLRDILKGEWGFKGFVASDWYSGTRSTVGGANNGLDIEMPFEQFYGEKLYQAVLRGDVKEDVIEEAAARILRMKFRFRLFDEAPEIDPGVIQNPEHTQLALEAAHEGIVLLKNRDRALPLVREDLDRIAVVGPLADVARLGDLGSSTVIPSYAITPLEGLRNRSENVEVLSYTGTDPQEAARMAVQADAVVVVAALTVMDEGEQNMPLPSYGGDRLDLALRPEDVELIRAVAAVHDRVVVVIEAGGAITGEPWIDEVEAVIMAWYPGLEGGHAIADVLFGDVNPSGKLPFTVPHEDDPLYEFGSGQDSIEYGYYHGYRYFDLKGLVPRFPFGFGLSYTAFSYTNIRLSQGAVRENGSLRVSFDLTNTGERAGKEIVQLYVAYPNARVERPVRELKAFSKVALDPGEKQSVILELPASDLAYYDDVAGRWRIEKGQHVIEVGPSSRDLPLQAVFSIE